MTPRPSLPFEPLPGTRPPERGLFVDRWGTLLEPDGQGANVRYESPRFLPGAVDALFRAQQAGWRVYLIGNEDAVALGRQTDAAWERFEADLIHELARGGVRPQRIYACLEHPDGRGDHMKPSVFRLPDTGLLFHAAQQDGVLLAQSWVIGDSTLELAAGGRVGCKLAAVRTGLALEDGELFVEPDLWLDTLGHVVDLLLRSPAYSRPR